MNEWVVVTVIVVLAGLIISIAKPLISLNTILTTLSIAVDNLKANISDMNESNRKSHERIWDHNEEQDAKIEDHEKRITNLEESRN